MADPYGNASLNTAIGAFLLTGLTYIFCLIYIVMVSLAKKAYPFFFAITLILILWNAYEIFHLLRTANVYDYKFYTKHYIPLFIFSAVFYVFFIILGLSLNIRKNRIKPQ